MTADSPSAPQIVPSSQGTVRATEIDQSCRWPVLLLFTAAALWLALGGVMGFLTAIKAHAPGFLPGPGWLTYGRVRPVAANAIVYGFVLQAGLGIALWMICRLGRTILQGGWVIAAAAAFWNIGMVLGLFGIFAGESTGYEWLEMPGFGSPVLFCAYLLIVAWAVINLHAREERALYVSQWFLLLGLLWFPWVYSTAQLLLVFSPVRGVMQAVVNGWYAHNLFELCLAPFGLASIFYFLPKLLGKPLHSRGLALFGFWLLVAFGGWGGLQAGLPVPNWVSGVSTVGRMFLLLPILAIGMSWYGTWQGHKAPKSDVLPFILLAAVSYFLSALLETAAAHPLISHTTLFTLYGQGVAQFRVHGFLALALAGAIYYIAPRIAGVELPWPGLVRIHFWLASAGVVLSAVALIVGGIVQGARINQPQTDFMQIVRGLLPFLGTGTLGATLLMAAYAIPLVQLGRLLNGCCPCRNLGRACRPVALVSTVSGRTHA